MKVTHRNNKNIHIEGELISRLDRTVTFLPTNQLYDKERLIISDASIAIGGGEDDNVIMVKGYIRSGDLYKNDLICFYPVIK